MSENAQIIITKHKNQDDEVTIDYWNTSTLEGIELSADCLKEFIKREVKESQDVELTNSMITELIDQLDELKIEEKVNDV